MMHTKSMNYTIENLSFLLPKWPYCHGEDEKLSQQKTLGNNLLRNIKLSRDFCLNTKGLII